MSFQPASQDEPAQIFVLGDGAIGTTYLIESDVAPGIEALETATALAPDRFDYALHLLGYYYRTDNPKAAALEAKLAAMRRPAVDQSLRARGSA